MTDKMKMERKGPMFQRTKELLLIKKKRVRIKAANR